MGIKRWVADADSTITNAFKENLTTRAVSSSMGDSDILEVFSLYGQGLDTASLEASRVLVQFPVTEISTARTDGDIPSSGSVNFYLKLSNAPHGQSTPKRFTLVVNPLSQSWDEGFGMDMEQYKDEGAVNWLSASATENWTTAGGDILNTPSYSQYFKKGTEDLEVEITDLVEEWVAETIDNNGILVKLTGSEESATRSYYTKKFFGRGSQFFFKRPWIEARWDSAIKDDRNNFRVSSSLLPGADNLNTLYIYNRVGNTLVDIPAVGTGSIYVSLYSGSTAPTGSALTLHNGATAVTGGWVSTGVYSASVGLYTTSSYVYDVWHDNNGTEFVTGSKIDVFQHLGASSFEIPRYVLNITNMKPEYDDSETARFRLYVRRKDWSPTIYTIAINDIETETIEKAYYKVFRLSDGLDVIPYGTGSTQHTLLSYDREGNYFDLDMSLLEYGYAYGIKFKFLLDNKYYEQRETFKFRVESGDV